MPNSLLTPDQAASRLRDDIMAVAGKMTKRFAITEAEALEILYYDWSVSDACLFPRDIAKEKRFARLLSRARN